MRASSGAVGILDHVSGIRPDVVDFIFDQGRTATDRQLRDLDSLDAKAAQIFSAGDVLSTGTVSGVAGFSPDAASLYLKPGDVIEAEIERIGVLRNPVVSWQEAHGEPAPARVRW